MSQRSVYDFILFDTFINDLLSRDGMLIIFAVDTKLEVITKIPDTIALEYILLVSKGS